MRWIAFYSYRLCSCWRQPVKIKNSRVPPTATTATNAEPTTTVERGRFRHREN